MGIIGKCVKNVKILENFINKNIPQTDLHCACTDTYNGIKMGTDNLLQAARHSYQIIGNI